MMRLSHDTLRNFVLAGLALTCSIPVAAQEAPPPVEPTAQLESAEPEAIPVVQITDRSGEARALVRAAVEQISADERLTQIMEDYPAELQRIEQLRQKSAELLRTPGRASNVQEIEKATLRSRDRVDRWTRDLVIRSSSLESTFENLRSERSLWEQTRDSERDEELPPELMTQVAEILEILRSTESDIRSSRDKVLTLQADLAQQRNSLEEMLARQSEEIAHRATSLWRIDAPPFWRALGNDEEGGFIAQVRGIVRGQWNDLSGYLAETGTRFLKWVVLWIVLATWLVYLRRKARLWPSQDPALASAAIVLDRPLTAAAVSVIVLINVVEMQAPAAWLDAINLVLLLSLVLLILGMVRGAFRPVPYLLIPLYLLFQMVRIAPVGSIAQRLSMFLLSLVGGAACWWFLRTLRSSSTGLSPTWKRLIESGARIGILLFAAGLAANAVGAILLGSLMVTGTMDAIFTALIVWIVGTLFSAGVTVAIVSPTVRRLELAPEHRDSIHQRMSQLIWLVLAIVWAVFALKGFLLYDSVLNKIAGVLDFDLSIGAFSIDLGQILLFVFIVWLSVKLATLVEFVLEVLVLPRWNLPRGAPQAIGRVSRYAFILGGLLVAITAVGFDISQAALVAGGLGVGIGFGLQTVVSNFVSGLILLFERPIRVGDIVELGAISGTIENIGMRATQVRTWNGSELIVPNAKLISSDVINWTLKHDRRRLEIELGVAYGSDPETVTQLLIAAATRHSEIDAYPAPKCLFTGFGESSLDFQLRAWTSASTCLSVGSDLRFAIARDLDAAGISIPFPQRDIHIRSTSAAEGADGTPGDFDRPATESVTHDHGHDKGPNQGSRRSS